jgi:hypothetical protein
MATAKTKTRSVAPSVKKAPQALLDVAGSVVDTASEQRFVEPNEPNPLGGASKADLVAVVCEQLGQDPDYEATEGAIAVESLARIVAARMAHTDWKKDAKRLGVFMVSDRAREMAEAVKAIKEPIIDNGSRELTGKLWITGPNFASGYYLQFTSAEPGEMFEEVKSQGFGQRPALVFDPTATDAEIRYYPNGLDEEARVQRFMISRHTFTLTALDALMKRLHEQSIITPDAALPDFNPWKEATKYIPRPDTEAFFQGMLKLVLDVAFGPRCRIQFEVRGTEGRCDLLISSRRSANAWTAHAALELKVLRSFTSGGSAVSAPSRARAIVDGLLQAIAYRNENNAKDGLLCCFDLRAPQHYDGLSCFEPIKRKASKQTINLRHFRIYGSSEDLRKDKYSQA